MKPLELLGETLAPDGTDIKLTRRDNEYIILANGKSLMSSRMHGSEEALATLACRRARTMDLVQATAQIPSMVDWYRSLRLAVTGLAVPPAWPAGHAPAFRARCAQTT